MMIKDSLKKSIVGILGRLHYFCRLLIPHPEHAKVFYSDRWPVESNWAVTNEKDEDGLYQAFLYVQPGTTGIIRYEFVDVSEGYDSKKDALQRLLEELEERLARG
jgi:hypothetical protein